MAPSNLVLMPRPYVADQMMLAHVEDHAAMVNVTPFAMCTTPANPAVASATAMAMGVPTPALCMPQLPMPWNRGSQFLSADVSKGRSLPVLTSDSTLNCMYGGSISIVEPACRIKIDG
jgi:hypothetical protein